MRQRISFAIVVLLLFSISAFPGGLSGGPANPPQVFIGQDKTFNVGHLNYKADAYACGDSRCLADLTLDTGTGAVHLQNQDGTAVTGERGLGWQFELVPACNGQSTGAAYSLVFGFNYSAAASATPLFGSATAEIDARSSASATTGTPTNATPAATATGGVPTSSGTIVGFTLPVQTVANKTYEPILTGKGTVTLQSNQLLTPSADAVATVHPTTVKLSFGDTTPPTVAPHISPGGLESQVSAGFLGYQNTTDLRTGVTRSVSSLPNREETWVYLAFDDATWTIAGSTFQLAASSGSANSTGEMQLRSATGGMSTSAARYESAGDAELTGAFSSNLEPSGSTTPTLTVEVQGQLSSTTMAEVQLPAGTATSTNLPVVFALLFGGVVAGGGLYAGLRRQRTNLAHAADECQELAQAAADAERWHDALGWIRKARKLTPASWRLRMDEAYYLAQTGEPDEAVAAYLDAAAQGGDGEAKFEAALLLVHLNQASRAEPLLEEALAALPHLAIELEERMPNYVAGPTLRRLISRARNQSGSS